MTKKKKFVMWVGGLTGVVVLIGAGAWVGTGFAAAYNEAPGAYKEMESLGVPLDADAFLASFSPPADQNCAEELIPALADLKVTDESLDPKVKEAATTFVWSKKEDYVSTENRLKALKQYKESMDNVRAASKKPYCVPQQSWADAVHVDFSELSGYRLATKLSCMEAVTRATMGNRTLAIQRLKESVHYGNLAGHTPTLIASLVHIAINSIVCRTVQECIIADPKGAESYAAVLDQVKLKPFGYALRGEAFFTHTTYRIYSLKQSLDMMKFEEGGEDVKPKNPAKSGLPTDLRMRAYMGYSLKRWIPLIRQINNDGTPKNKEAFERELVRFEKDAEKTSGPITLLHNSMTPIFAQAGTAVIGGNANLAAVKAFAKVVAFRNRNGAYPKTLAEAGVKTVDPFSKEGKPLGYSVKNGQMRVWSIGKNRVNDGGITLIEANERDETSGANALLEKGDIVFVMRPAGTFPQY